MAEELPSWEDALANPIAEPSGAPELPSWEDAIKDEEPSALSLTWKAWAAPGFNPSDKELQDMSEAQREFMKKTSVGRVMSAFGQGFDQGDGDEMYGPSEETRQFMQKVGLFNDYEKGQTNLAKGVLEGLVVPSADFLWRKAMVAPFAGAQAAAIQFGKEVGSPALGRDLALLPEAFPAGIKQAAGVPIPHVVKKGVSEGIIGVPEDVAMGIKEATPEQMRKMNEATSDMPAPEDIHAIAERIAPEGVARYRELEDKRDFLRSSIESQKAAEVAQIEAAFSTGRFADEVADLQAKVSEAKARGNKSVYEDILNKKLAEKAEAIEKIKSTDTAEVQALRKQLQEADYQMRDLAPEVSRAYREADAQMPKDEMPMVAAIEETASPVVEAMPAPEMRRAITDDFTQKWVEAGHNAEEANAFGGYVALRFEELSRRLGNQKSALELYKERSADVVAGKERKVAPQELAQDIESLFDYRPEAREIPQDNYSKDLSSYSPVMYRETSANGALELLPYGNVFTEIHDLYLADTLDMATGQGGNKGVTIAFDTKGLTGARNTSKPTANLSFSQGFGEYFGKRNKQSSYQKAVIGVRISKDAQISKVDRAMLKRTLTSLEENGWTKTETEKYIEYKKPAELSQTTKGKIRRATDDAKALITRFNRSDFSTMVHETGHEWLDDLMRDALDDMATAALKRDAQTVKNWLKVEGELTTRQHEKFARSFERYFMEGVAPTRQLAGVFEKFKNWMMDIYKWINEKRYPINDDIRDVFHRFVAEKPEPTVIAPEKRGEKVSAAIHEADAIETPPERAAEAISTIRREADDIAKLDPEIADAILTRPTGGQPAATGEAGTPAGGTPESAKAATAKNPEAINLGGDIARAEGDTPFGEPEPGSTPKGPNERMGRPVDGYVDKAGNIRLDNLNTPEDINTVLREVAEENEGFMTARRGVISDAQAMDLADSLGMDAKTLDLRKIGEAFNAEQIIAARKLLIQSATETREAMVKAAIGDDAAVMKYAEMRARHQMIQEQVSGITAEAGRALRAFREIGGAQDAKLLTEFLQSQTGKTLYELKQEAMLGAKLDTPQKVSKFINDSKKPTLRDMVVEAWVNGLLSGPVTFMTNLKGNLAIALYSIPETGVAGMIGGARRALTGSAEGVRVAEAKARLFGLLEGSREGIISVAKIFNDEEALSAFVGNTTTETRKMQAIPGTAGKATRTPSRIMNATDAVFKSAAYRSEINAMAWRKALEEGLEGQPFMQRVAELTNSPTEAMMRSATDYKNYQTLTRDLEEFGQKLQQLANTDLWGVPIPKILVPFIRTPGNLLKYAGERTPLAVFSSRVRDNLSGKNGKVMQDTQMARITLGTTLGLATMSLAIEGLITGGGPSDPEDRAKWRLAGWQPYSVKIGDSYYSYARLDPFATMLGITADAVETLEREGSTEEEKDSVGELLFWSFTENLMSKLSLRGASDLITAVTDRDRYGDKYVQRLAGTAVPNFLAQAARTMDPVQRETYTVLESLKSRIPVMREDLLPRRDVWGEPIVSQGAVGPDILSSIYVSKISQDPVNQRLLDLNYSPSKLGRNIRGVDLTPAQYDEYQKLAGRMAKMRLDVVVKQPGFAQMPDFVQINVIKKTVDSSRETARSLMMMRNPDIIQKAIDIKRKAVRENY